MSVVDKIQHYQRNIEKCTDNEDRMLHCISKLYSLPVTVQHLQETGVGRTVNALRKYDGGVGNAAKALVAKWKKMVADEETSDEDDEDEACVPDAPESYSDNPESPRFKEDVSSTNAIKTSRHKNEDEKHKHRYKTEKSDGSVTGHNSKQVLKQDSRSNDCKDSDTHKNSKSESEKFNKHEKSRHSQKYEIKSDRKSSSKDLGSIAKSSPTKHDSHTSKDKSRSKPESSKSLDNELNRSESNDSSHKKRKLDSTNFDKKQSKRRRNSSGESDKECTEISFSGKHSLNNSSNAVSDFEAEKKTLEVKVKEEPCEYSSKEQSSSIKSEVKTEKRDVHEKHRHSSSKSKSGESSSKLKDSEERHKDKTESRENIVKSEKKDGGTHHSSKESHKSKSHHSSSSSSKDHSKNKDRNKRKDNKTEKDKETELKSSKSSRKEVREKVKVKHEINGDEGIDCNSGASFAEALGMCTVAQPSRKRNNHSPNVVSKSIKVEPVAVSSVNNKKISPLKSASTSNDDPLNPPSLLAPNVKLEPLSVDLASTLPEISPNYKPLPFINPVHRKDEDKFLNDVIYVKNQRTKVYSGNKSGYTSVPSLYEICIRVLIENIDALEFTGGVPYDILKPVFERATPDQLFMLEHYNPYIIEDTDPLWQYHCTREFRNKQREEMESWREMYMRCLDEREAKFKTLTANIRQSIDKSMPVRSTKLAYVDNIVKPPRNVLKQQAKYGTANSTPTSTSDLKKKLIAGGGAGGATNISVPPPPMSRTRTSSSGVVKKTKAPLMAKALQLIKGRYKR